MSSNLKDDPALEQALINAVAFALMNVKELKPRPRMGPDPREAVARKVVAYLKLSNWVITKGPPRKDHSIP